MFIHSIIMNKGDGACSRALGKGSLLVFASLKQRFSAVSQALARQQILTHITINNIEKNKTKQKINQIFSKMKILWLYCIIVKSLSIDFRKREKRHTSISLEWTDRTLASDNVLSCRVPIKAAGCSH